MKVSLPPLLPRVAINVNEMGVQNMNSYESWMEDRAWKYNAMCQIVQFLGNFP